MARVLLKGEGDLNRRFAQFGFEVTHVQSSVDEFNFVVENLAVDLGDGIRLVK